MPLDVPNLDDRRWADLVDEGRELIARFAPAWTDHNAHDPGITFIELFAWLVEMQIYQVNRVSDRHREVFARLAGVRRCHQRPARVRIHVIGHPRDSRLIPAGEQVVPLDGHGFVFQTDEDVQLTRSRLQAIVVDDAIAPVEQTAANHKAGVAFLAFGDRADEGHSLLLGFDELYPRAEPHLRLTFDVVTEDLAGACGPEAPTAADCSAREPSVVAPVDLVWEYERQGGSWSALAVIKDETAGLTRSGTITLATPSSAVRRDQLMWIRARIASGYYDIEPRLRGVALNVLPCSQRQAFYDEELARCAGRPGGPDQSFEVANGPIVVPDAPDARPVTVRVGRDEWTNVEAFDESGPSSPHFTFDSPTRRVTFGNGLNGRIPSASQRVVAIRYETSFGRAGNVARGLQWALRGGISGVTLTNPEPASGGADEERLGDLELRTQALIRRATRGVTLADLERLALETPNAHVARAKALPNCPTVDRITIVAVPKSRPGRHGAPRSPSPSFLQAVRRQLQRHRLLCDDLRVTGPLSIEVRVTASLRLAERASADAVIARARAALDAFLSGRSAPAATGVSPAGSPCPSGWPFGRDVFPSEVYAELDRVAGVDAVSGLVLTASSESGPIESLDDGTIPIPTTGVVFAGAHNLSVVAQKAGSGR